MNQVDFYTMESVGFRIYNACCGHYGATQTSSICNRQGRPCAVRPSHLFCRMIVRHDEDSLSFVGGRESVCHRCFKSGR
jgi:hypothetical protein